ncbi:hypothetical protein [Oceanobacillus halophilus]|uniref:Spore coat protein n=1 Tax=Oceanobacillus halophilus TaxID=930130 RepID=A0A495ABH1_9BACI|nr:hypothetical protein [Oceanobacillus halophilus]RKQ37252.1 hypothetical protein D8M06_00105 [Oceanobacillus halophilus]
MEKTKTFKALKGKVVQINRGGSESKIGKLIAVKDDYVALLTKDDGVIYYQTKHIKSVTENVKHHYDLEVKELNKKDHLPDDFIKLLISCKYDWLQINRGGKEKVDGIVNEVKDHVLTIVDNKEVIRVFIDKIKNVSIGEKPKKH